MRPGTNARGLENKLTTVGMIRCKNEARWIERCVSSIMPVCDRVIVLDDSSTDNTREIAAAAGAAVIKSPFTGLAESRDKNFLLDCVSELDPDWIICIDGDEMLRPGSVAPLKAALETSARSISMRIWYLWDREDQIRVDGVYGEFRRHSAFRPGPYVYTSGQSGGLHCGNVPMAAWAGALSLDTVELLHFGYLHREDRERKYCWYNARDPNNAREDRYKHIAAGLTVSHAELCARQIAMRIEAGLPPLKLNEILPRPPAADEKTAHAGPLALRKIN